MQAITHTIGTVLGRMVKALFVWGIIVGAVATGWFSLNAHRLPAAGEWGLVITIAVIAGLLGMMATLVWELSHLGYISRKIRERQEQRHAT